VVDLGPTQLKNIAEPIRVYSLQDGVPAQAKSARGPAPEKSAPSRLSMVVLPFANIGGAEQEHFVDGSRRASRPTSHGYEDSSSSPQHRIYVQGQTALREDDRTRA
jgi:hypothetical protein